MKSLGFEPRQDDLKAMLGSIDDDENGTINFEEFLDMMTIKISESAAKKECEKAFRVMKRLIAASMIRHAPFSFMRSYWTPKSKAS